MKNLFACLLLYSLSSGLASASNGDPHYGSTGFFDIHLCNWPGEGRFVMALFSTECFQEIERVSIFAPDGEKLGDLNLAKFRAFTSPKGKAKRAFIEHFPLPEQARDGWYRAEARLRDGRSEETRDYVVHVFMPFPTGMTPAPGAQDIDMPTELSWAAIPGASHYQVFIRDKWDDSLLFQSDLLTAPRLALPGNLLQPGGLYGWRIHARDVNEHVLLGDFNHGTTSAEFTFSVRQ